MGFFWKRSNYAAGLFGILGGILIQVAIVAGLYLAEIQLHWLYVAFIAQVAIMAGMFVDLARPPEPPLPEQWEPFSGGRPCSRDIDGAEGRPWYQTLRFWGAVFVVIWSVLYWWFW